MAAEQCGFLLHHILWGLSFLISLPMPQIRLFSFGAAPSAPLVWGRRSGCPGASLWGRCTWEEDFVFLSERSIDVCAKIGSRRWNQR